MRTFEHFHLPTAILRAWSSISTFSQSLGTVHFWRPTAGRERIGAPGFEQHCTVTLVVGICGHTRVEGLSIIDLGPGDVLVIGAGTWHRHLPLTDDDSCFRQGFILDRSDFHVVVGSQVLVGCIPREPSWALMQRLLADTAPAASQAVMGCLLQEAVRHGMRPLAVAHPAVLAMQYALWETLHLHQGVQRIITASNLHRAQAYRLAQSHWGMGISQMRTQVRMRLASELLRAGIPVAETAFRCGSGNVRSFSRLFQAFHGHPPSRHNEMRMLGSAS